MDYFLHARELQIEAHYGLNFRTHLAQTGKTWFIVSNQISYFKPARTGETIVIASKLIDYSESELLVEFMMFDQNEAELKSIAWTRFKYIDIQHQKSAVHPPELTDLFVKAHSPVDQAVFELRAANLKKKKTESVDW